VWLSFRFSLSFRDVEELLAQRGIAVTYETVRQWCLKFGQTYANELRRHRPRCGDKRQLDEVFLTISGKRHYLWRAVDQDGNVLDILVQSRRNKHAAKRFFREILPGVEHRQHKGLNNRTENSHQPTRLREKKMRRFKSAKHAQRFLSAFGLISGHFQPRRHCLSAEEYRAILQTQFRIWNEVTEVKLVG
jgi:putative transposase